MITAVYLVVISSPSILNIEVFFPVCLLSLNAVAEGMKTKDKTKIWLK